MSTVASQKRRAPVPGSRRTLDREHQRMTSSFTSASEEAAYYKETAFVLYQYASVVENPGAHQNGPDAPVPKNSIVDLLNVQRSVHAPECDVFEPADEYGGSGGAQEQDTDPVPHRCGGLSRGELLDIYRARVHREVPPVQMQTGGDVCSHCGCQEVVVVSTEAVYSCPECGTVDSMMVQGERPNYRDPPRETVYMCYKRANHFQEWISQTQGREHTSIPDSVYDSILTELKKQRVQDVSKLSVKKLRDVMKKLTLNRYFEHIPHILNHLNGVASIHIPPDLEAQMRRMFQQIQAPFIRHAPATRKNFLSYSFVLHKFAQLLGYPELLPHFPLLKSRLKLMQQDDIWRGICADLSWEFIPSL